MAGNTAPLDDHALNHELKALLAVEPSAGFNARVLAAATARPRWGLSWVLAPAGALAVAALVIALVIQLRSDGPANHTLAGRPFATPVAVTPWIPASPAGASPLPVPTASRRRATRHLRRQAHDQPTEPVVLVALDESRALGRLLARARPLQVASANDDRALPLLVDGAAPVPPLHVPLLSIEPLVPSEDLSGGARP